MATVKTLITTLLFIFLMYYFYLNSALTNDTVDRFILVPQPMNFTIAEQYCQQLYGTHLATMLSISDVLQARSICQQSNLSCWIGLNDIQIEDKWVYTSGKIYEESVQDWYQMPGSRQPNGGYSQNCVIIWLDYDYAWNDYMCYYKSAFLCDVHTLNPTPQTISPSISPILTTSPTPSPTITDRFILVNEDKNFADAESYCQNHYGTHLATIRTPLDINQTKLLCQTIASDNYLFGCWIGLYYDHEQNETAWMFTSGRGFNWQVGDWRYTTSLVPDYDYDSCVAIWGSYDFEWRKLTNYCIYYELPFICDASTLSPTSDTVPPIPSPTVTDRFILVKEWMDFYDAESYCKKNYGTHLATITTQLDINHTKLMCQNAISWYDWGCWIGLREIYTDRQFQWTFTSGRKLDNQVQDWRYSMATSYYYSSNCAAIRDVYQYAWDNHDCSYKLPAFICDTHTFSPTTSAPTRETLSPSQFPSRSPTSFTYSPTSLSNEESINEEEVNIKWIIITILSVCVIVLIVLVIVICLITKWKDKRDSHSKHERIDNRDDEDNDLEMVQFKNAEIENWLKDKCNLVQYLNNFVGNGYETTEMISNIDNIEELEEIGIALKGHQKMILSEIMKLKQSEGQNEEEGELVTLNS